MGNISDESVAIEESDKRGGIQSIEVGAPLLRALVDGGDAMTLTALATRAHMPLSKAHKYLASFVRIGLMTQSANTLYKLGPFARELGLAALKRSDVIDLSQDFLDELNASLDLTASMSVWSEHGPVIVRRRENKDRISLVVPLGSAVPVLNSSNGRIYAAFGDPRLVQPLIDRELAANRQSDDAGRIATIEALDAMLADVRATGVAATQGARTPGVGALSAPVFDQGGKLVAALTVLGFSGEVDRDLAGEPVRRLKSAAEQLSRQIGGSGFEEPSMDRAENSQAMRD